MNPVFETSASRSDDGWGVLSNVEWITLAVIAIAASALLFPRVIWAPCLDDPGEFQLAAAVGGICHPPGHAGIVTIHRLFCVISPTAPHLTVSAVNATFAIVTILILAAFMLRTGAHPVAAIFACGVVFADDYFWHAAVTPETYATCFMLLMLSLWSFLHWLHAPRLLTFALATLPFMYLIANRGHMLTFALPVVVATAMSPQARRALFSKPFAYVGILCSSAVLAALVLWASLWFRDVPGSAYNYLVQCYTSFPDFPSGNIAASDKWQRILWLVTARQFDYMFHPTWDSAVSQAQWVASEVHLAYWPITLAAFAVFMVGVISLWRTRRIVAVFALLMIPAAIVPMLLIGVRSNTAMIPNLMFPLAWLLAIGLTRLWMWRAADWWHVCLALVIIFCVWFSTQQSLFPIENRYDARPHIARMNLESLPRDAILLTNFDAAPLIYAQQFFGLRRDLTILHESGRLNRPFVLATDRPVTATRGVLPDDLMAEPIRDTPIRRIRARNPAE